MQTMTLDNAKTHLADLIDAAVAGEEVFIVRDEGLAVQLVPRTVKNPKRQFGSARGPISMSADFDGPLDDFKDYME